MHIDVISLGSLGLFAAVAALTCGGVMVESGRTVGGFPLFPLVPRRIWHASGTAPSPERALAELSPGASEPQPTTVSHDGGCADQSRTCVPRRTPTGLSHAAMSSTRASYAGRSVAVRPWVMTSSPRSNLGGGTALG